MNKATFLILTISEGMVASFETRYDSGQARKIYDETPVPDGGAVELVLISPTGYFGSAESLDRKTSNETP